MPAAGVTVADIQAIKRICGAGGWVDGGGVDAAAFTVDRREKFHGRAALIAMPGSAAEVAEVLRHCNARGIGVVPQGGNTGMVGGATPSAGGGQIILHLGRMNRIREVDRANSTVSAEAGCVLAAVQEAARREGLLFPLAMGSQGSCMVGGALSTNAGGVRVLRYGNARELTLGLEVALADGRVLDGMNKLRKNSSGYDWKQWFIGAEGTLGVVTAAVLRLFPDESQAHTCWLALGGARDAVRLLGEFRGSLGGALSCFEFMEGECVAQVLRAIPGVRNPLAKNYPAYVLAQSGAQSAAAAGGEILPALLARLLDENKILDAAIAAGEAQAANLWKIRESIPEAEKKRGAHRRIPAHQANPHRPRAKHGRRRPGRRATAHSWIISGAGRGRVARRRRAHSLPAGQPRPVPRRAAALWRLPRHGAKNSARCRPVAGRPPH